MIDACAIWARSDFLFWLRYYSPVKLYPFQVEMARVLMSGERMVLLDGRMLGKATVRKAFLAFEQARKQP